MTAQAHIRGLLQVMLCVLELCWLVAAANPNVLLAVVRVVVQQLDQAALTVKNIMQ